MGIASDTFDFVVVGAGSCGATLAGRLTEDPADTRPPARGRPARSLALDPPADRLRQDDVGRRAQLALRDRSRSRHERPAHLLAARQDARRLELDQRPDLHPRPARGLRPLGRAGQPRLGLRRRAAVLHQVRRQRARRERLPRRRRAAEGLGHRCPRRAHRGLHRRRRGSSACRATTTSTAPARRAPATTSSRPTGAGAAARRRRS